MMKKIAQIVKRAVLILCAGLLCVGAMPAVALTATEPGYVEPGYVVDFSSYNAIDACYDVFNLTPSPEEGAMVLRFTDTGGGRCFDPYLSLPLDTGKYSCEEYPYLALLVKTNKHDLKGQLRFRTSSTGSNYPCQNFTYQKTDDWQVVVVPLTDRGTLLFYPADGALTGGYTNLRLDMFENECALDTVYAVKAYALYKTAEEAATFIHYKSRVEQEEQDKEDILNSVDYGAFWQGDAFKLPAMDKRMRWVTAGYTNNNAAVDKLIRQGYGGFTSNVLYNQAYLRDDAEFAVLKSTFDYAADRGMNLWIYDEYQWPSGKAFGLVLEGHDEYEATGIQHKRMTGTGGTVSYTPSGKEIRVMQAVLVDDGGTRNLEVRADGGVSAPAAGKWWLDVYVLRYTFDGVEDPANWEMLRDVDLLNPASVQRFLQVTHEQYKSKLGSTFDRVQGFFTDEPQLGNRAMLSYAVWTPDLDKKFLETYGYELNIPSLFSGSSSYDRIIRMNYYRLVASLFKSSYIDQITAWCEANGTLSSGHLLFEEDMNDHVETYGGDFLQFVGGMSVPGADILLVNPEYLMEKRNIGNYMGLRYVASAAKNAGKADVFLEYNPDAADALPDDVMPPSLGGASISRLLGCNLFHVINPQYNYTTDQLMELNNYVGRMNTVLDEVNECGDVAVFYPIATIQALHDADTDHSSTTGGDRKSTAYKLNAKYEDLCKTLLTNQFMFTVLDDETIRAATVTADGRLVAGLGSYRVVILAYSRYISVEALEKLTVFTRAGGTVILVGDTPEHGLRLEQEEAISALMAKLEGQPSMTTLKPTALIDLLEEKAHRDLNISVVKGDKAKLLMGDFESADRDVTFLVNASYSDTVVKLSYTDGYTGEAALYHPHTGYIETVIPGAGKEITVPASVGLILVREADNSRDDTPYVPDATPDDTSAPTDTTVEEHTQKGPSGKGCRSSLSLGASALLPAAIAVIYRKKKEN
ncbi:MAG: hypothetical protein IJD38_10535 [Clostridia bacterium]|nr:hypothetical protein [Clostridia bacterium]